MLRQSAWSSSKASALQYNYSGEEIISKGSLVQKTHKSYVRIIANKDIFFSDVGVDGRRNSRRSLNIVDEIIEDEFDCVSRLFALDIGLKI